MGAGTASSSGARYETPPPLPLSCTFTTPPRNHAQRRARLRGCGWATTSSFPSPYWVVSDPRRRHPQAYTLTFTHTHTHTRPPRTHARECPGQVCFARRLAAARAPCLRSNGSARRGVAHKRNAGVRWHSHSGRPGRGPCPLLSGKGAARARMGARMGGTRNAAAGLLLPATVMDERQTTPADAATPRPRTCSIPGATGCLPIAFVSVAFWRECVQPSASASRSPN